MAGKTQSGSESLFPNGFVSLRPQQHALGQSFKAKLFVLVIKSSGVVRKASVNVAKHELEDIIIYKYTAKKSHY